MSFLREEDGVFIEHLGVNVHMFGEETHEKPEVTVGNVYHRSDCEIFSLGKSF